MTEMEIEGEKQQKFDVDLGNLMALDSNHTFPSQPPLSRYTGTVFFLFFRVFSFLTLSLLTLIEHREEIVKQCLLKGTHLVQAIADALFTLPSTEDVDGPLVNLPAPLTKLPREKHVIPHSNLYSSLNSKLV